MVRPEATVVTAWEWRAAGDMQPVPFGLQLSLHALVRAIFLLAEHGAVGAEGEGS
jgi:hypothetical protein